MSRSDRLFDILQILRDGGLHRAGDIAAKLGVSTRTVYRDMETLAATGVPVEGERGSGYTVRDLVTLPPLSLTPDELEALNLGIAIVCEASDADLRTAALGLADKIDAALPEQALDAADAWKFAVHPFADAARGFSQMPVLRAAIKARQKLRVTSLSPDGEAGARIVRPLRLEHWGRVWTLTAWCESRSRFGVFRVDLIEKAEAMPELFVDEPGKRLADFRP